MALASTRRGHLLPGLLLALALAPVAAGAQPARPEAPPVGGVRADLADLRHQVYVMEGALVRAVEFGAQKLNREIRAVVPDLYLLSGSARALKYRRSGPRLGSRRARLSRWVRAMGHLGGVVVNADRASSGAECNALRWG